MIELIKYVVGCFAEKPEEACYDVQEDGNVVTVTVTLAASDMGKVIGRQGKLAKALRTLVRAGSAKENKKYNVEIKERGEKEQLPPFFNLLKKCLIRLKSGLSLNRKG